MRCATALPRRLRRPFSTPWWRGCRLRYAPFRSMAVRSSTPPSKPGVSGAAFTCSCCSRARTSSTARSSAQRAHTEEFYEPRPFENFTVESLNREARAWERIYNTARPHQALGYLTPLEFLRGALREANASRLNHPVRASSPGSRVARATSGASLPLSWHTSRAISRQFQSVTHVVNE
jgi:hypothetical protein